jgi:hypothetical protein
LLPARRSPPVVVSHLDAADRARSPPQIDDLGKARHRLGIFPARV